MIHEMDAAADLGVELFVVDAGWYKASADPSDFTTGIGVWEADADRFPSGLSALSDHAHALGMKFGIWVEPERVDLQTVGRAGLAKERWLATQAGPLRSGEDKTPSANSAQVCLASREARDWILGRLTALIDAAHPDYLKWDNNFWINCTRSGHGHDRDDGNFAHVSALEQVLATLRATISRPADRELLGRGQSPRAEHAGVFRHGLDGRSVAAGVARSSQPRGAERADAAVDPLVVRLRERVGRRRRPRRSGAGLPEPHARHPRDDLAERRIGRRVAPGHPPGNRNLQSAPRRTIGPDRAPAVAAGQRRAVGWMGRAAADVRELRPIR